MQGGKIPVYSGMLKITKNTNGKAAVIGHEIAMFLNLPFMFLERVDGEFELRRGFSFEKGSNFLMIEDVKINLIKKIIINHIN